MHLFGQNFNIMEELNKITIPPNIECYCTNYNSSLKFHVSFLYDEIFDEFCNKNNIGYHEGARQDVTKLYLQVVTTNKDIFENFPSNV